MVTNRIGTAVGLGYLLLLVLAFQAGTVCWLIATTLGIIVAIWTIRFLGPRIVNRIQRWHETRDVIDVESVPAITQTKPPDVKPTRVGTRRQPRRRKPN